MRRCLGCNVLIERDSRCALCRANYRPSEVRNALPKAVKGRDGYACTVQGCTTPFDRVQAHHVIPVAVGGAHELDNMTTLCHRHHLGVHHR